MAWDFPELADDSLFIEKIKNTYKSTESDLVIQVYTYISNKIYDGNSIGYKAANLLLKHGSDAITIACALLAPCYWKDSTSINHIREKFGTEIATTLEGFDSPFRPCIDTYNYNNKNVHSLLSSISGVPRKSLLFITFRILFLESETIIRTAIIKKIAQETLDFLVPVANQLSLGDLRRRLEDACFYNIDPEGYLELKKKVTPIQTDDNRCLQILLEGVQQLLKNNNIQNRIQGRTKSLYGIHRKMELTGNSLEKIMDRIGLRVILTSVPECYTVLGLLHSHFKPIPGTFDDYIGLPKDNGYQSLHTCVYPVREISQKPIEIQIRTELMHMEAEYGTAAHWRYKNESNIIKHDKQKFQWLNGLAHQHENAISTKAFIEMLYRQVFSDNMVIFGNGGRIVRLAEKATVQDYLNIANIHIPENGFVKVNGIIANINYSLKDGDSVEIYGPDKLLKEEPEVRKSLFRIKGTNSGNQSCYFGKSVDSGIRSPPSNQKSLMSEY